MLHGRYSLLCYYEPVRLPTGAAPVVIYSPRALVPPGETTSSGLPGSSTGLSSRAVPYHPGRPRRCPCPLLHGECQASSTGWTGHLQVPLTRPNRVHLRYGSRARFAGFAGRITPPHARSATCRMGNYRISSFQLTRSARLFLAHPRTGRHRRIRTAFSSTEEARRRRARLQICWITTSPTASPLA